MMSISNHSFINKSLCQTYEYVAVHMNDPVFSHLVRFVLLDQYLMQNIVHNEICKNVEKMKVIINVTQIANTFKKLIFPNNLV